MKQDSALKVLAYKLMLIIPDKWYLSLKFYKNFGRFPDWKSPKTFNEKLQWLKIYNRREEYPLMVDKYEAKKYVADRIGEGYIIPTLGVWDKPEDIDFDSLPDKFVLKATHDSGRVVICKDKAVLNREWAREEMRKSLKRDFYAVTREWPYKRVKRRIIAEKLLETTDGKDINDYKFFCFNGKMMFSKVDINRFSGHRANYHDKDWNLLTLEEAESPRNVEKDVIPPSGYQTMITLAEKLADGHPFMRVDFYEVGGKVYFGEITFFPASGIAHYNPSEWDITIGNMLKLPVN